jgi:hypothetical protein
MVLGHFALPDEAWWTGFYTPMEQRIRRLRPKYEGEAEAAHPLAPPEARSKCTGATLVTTLTSSSQRGRAADSRACPRYRPGRNPSRSVAIL